jgi:hypothetical protein
LLLLPDRLLNIYVFFCGIYKFPSKSTRAIELTRKGVNPRKIYYDNRFYAWLVKIVPITGREEENKKYALTRAAFDLVAICLVFFFSSPFTTANKNFSLDGVIQKRERG